MKKIQLFTFFVLIIVLPYKGLCTILHVPATYNSIQEGIDASVDGDVVLVEPGTYFENLYLNGKNIVLCSNYFMTSNPAFIASTIIDGSNAGRVITINNYENSSCQVIGLTIQHGNSTVPWTPVETDGGGGIFILDSSPQIHNCIIQNNQSSGFGGGLSLYGSLSSAKVMNCTIQNNTADSFGGGVFMGDCSPDATIVNCIITGNTNTNNNGFNGGGGGVNLYHSGKLENCLITNNSAPNSPVGGGGVQCDWADIANHSTLITGCTITQNTALNWGGTSYVIEGGEFRNCIIWGNTDNLGNPSNYDGNSYVYCCADPLPAGTGNISADPNFVDPVLGNFRLSTGSLCINSGDNSFATQTFDLDGNARINDNTVDMGAYENSDLAGIEVQIGSGFNQTSQFPIYSCYNYNYSQQIYLGSEITGGGGSAGLIKKIRFFYTGSGSQPSKWANWTVYLGNTAKTEFASTSDWVPVTSMTQVFTGIIPNPVDGTWLEITLPAPFYYSGSNIVVAVDENSSGYDCTAQWGSFYSGAPRGLHYYDDGTNPDPASPPDGIIDPSIDQIQFQINPAVGSIEGFVTEEPDCAVPIEGATIIIGAYSTSSDASGYYRLDLPVGTYDNLTAVYHDASQTISSIDITEGNTTTQDFCLAPYLAPPVGLQASITGPAQNNVHLTWMAPGSVADQWIHWDNGAIYGGLGYNAPMTFSVASRWPVSDIALYDGTYLKKIRFVPADANAAYTLKVWKGSNASNLLLSQVVADPIINGWNEVTLTTPILIDGTQELWFGYEIVETVNGYPAGLGPGPAVVGKGDMINSGGGWFSVKEAWGWEFNWTIQGFVSQSPVLVPQQLVPMVQNTSPQPIINNPVDASVKPQIIQFVQAPSSILPSGDLPASGEILPKPANMALLAPSASMTGYNVYRDNVKIADNIPHLFYNDLALPKGGYDYEVSAQYAFGESIRIGPVHVDIYTCFPPTGIMVSNSTLTTTTANLSWTPSTISTNHQWDLEWGTAGFTQGYGTSVLINTTPAYLLPGLTAGTEYDVYIRTHCSASDASAWVKKTFRTHFLNCPVGAVAEGETCGSSTNNGCEQAPVAYGTISNGETICGTSWLHRTHRDSDWYTFTITVPNDVTLSGNSEFTGYFALASTPCLSSQINYMNIWAGNAFQYTTRLNPGTYYVDVTSSYAEQVVCDSLSRYWVKITCNSCLAPTALNVANITTTSADLSWTSGSTAWNIEWGLVGFNQGAGTMISNTSSNPYHLSGLTMGNTYSYYVQSKCGIGATSNWTGPYTFYVPCPAVSLPYYEDFTTQSISSPPQCWQVHGAGALTNWLVNIGNSAGGTSPELSFCYYYPYFYGRSYLTSPVINTSGQTTLDLSFKNFIYSFSLDSSCEVWTTSDGGTTWNLVWSVSQNGYLGPETRNLTISTPDVGSSTFQFAFAVNGTSWQIEDWQIDDIALTGSSASKTLNLKVYLEGLYAGEGTMNPAFDEFGAHWPAGVADHITVELHNSATYATIEYTAPDVELSITGTATVSTPGDKNGSYYLTIKHRNSIETTSALPVDFSGAIISYAFDTQDQAYGNNMGLMIDGTSIIFGGDESQDGIVDGTDLSEIGNLADIAASGYLPQDINGDGLIDGSDLSVAGNNADVAVGAALP